MTTHLIRPTLLPVAAAALALALAAPGRADFITPAWRGAAGTTYHEWDAFDPVVGPTGLHAPDVAGFPDDSATLQNFADAFVTGGGNIYSPGSALVVDVAVPNYGLGDGTVTTVLLQVRTLGTEIDPATVALTPAGGAAQLFGSSQELARVALGGFGGSQVDTLFRWDVVGNASSYLIEFGALGSSMSLDRLAVDTRVAPAPVPEPTALALVFVGLVAAGSRAGLRRLGARRGPECS